MAPGENEFDTPVVEYTLLAGLIFAIQFAHKHLCVYHMLGMMESAGYELVLQNLQFNTNTHIEIDFIN